MSTIYQSQVAKSVPFNNDTNSFVSTDVQAAIEEVDTAIDNKAQYGAICAYNGTANAVKYLEFFASISSNTAGLVLAENSTLRSIAVSVQTATTATFTLYKNGVSIQTISLSSSRTNYISGLTTSLSTGDELSAAITSGSASNIILNFYIRTEGS